MDKGKTLLITGASGFLGSHIATYAKAHGYQVIPGIRKGAESKLVDTFKWPPFYFDLFNPESLKTTLEEYETKYGTIEFVIHCAGITRSKNLEDFTSGNTCFTETLATTFAQKKKRLQKFIFVSSLAANGPGDPKTMKGIHENDKANPVSPYGKSKLAAERHLLEMDLPWLIFRPTAIYGPRDHNFPKLYNLFKKGIDLRIGDADRQMSFVHVKDIAALLVEALDRPLTKKIYPVSDGNSYTQEAFNTLIKQSLNVHPFRLKIPLAAAIMVGHINEAIAKLKGEVAHMNAIKVKDLYSKNWVVDISSIKKDFQFQAKYDLSKVDFSKL